MNVVDLNDFTQFITNIGGFENLTGIHFFD